MKTPNTIPSDFSNTPKNIVILDKTIKACLYILVFLMPIWFLPVTSNYIGLPKQTLMIFLVVIALILWFVKLLSKGEFNCKNTPLNWVIISFLIIYILATFFSLRPYNSLMGFPSHLSGSLLSILGLVALYFLIINNFKNIKEAFSLIFIFLISSGIAILIGLLQLWGKFILPWDFAKNASFNTIGGSINILGIFSAVILTLSVALILTLKRTKIKIFLALLSLLSFLVLFSLNFWILWVTLGIGMIVLVIFGLARFYQANTQIGWLIIPLILLAISLIFILFSPSSILGLNMPIELGLSHKGGLNIVKQATQEQPILGSGPETFIFNYAKYKPLGINQTNFWNVEFNNPPSEILSILSDTGILGFLSFLAIAIMFIIQAIKNLVSDKSEMGAVNIGLFASLIALMVSWFLYSQNLTLMFVFWLFLGLLSLNIVTRTKTFNLKTSSTVALIASFVFVVVVLGAVSLLYLEGTRFVAEAKYKQGLDLVQENKLDQAITRVNRATVINPYEDRTYRYLAQLFLLKTNRLINDQEIEPEEQDRKVQLNASNAISSAVKATNLSPNNFSNWMIRGESYRQLIGTIGGAAQWAEESYKRAIKLTPGSPLVYNQLGRIYQSIANSLRAQLEQAQPAEKEKIQNEIDTYLSQAEQQFKKAIEVKSNYSPAHFELAVVYDAQGKIKQAISKMEEAYISSPQDSGVAFQLGLLYYKDSQFNSAKAAFERAINLNSDFSNARYFLGLLLDEQGDKQEAIYQFEKIAELNPDNQLIKQILENLRAGQPALGSPQESPLEQPQQVPIEEEQTGEITPSLPSSQ